MKLELSISIWLLSVSETSTKGYLQRVKSKENLTEGAAVLAKENLTEQCDQPPFAEMREW